MIKKKKEEIIRKLKLIKENALHLKESLFNSQKIGNQSRKKNKNEASKYLILSRMRAPPKKEGSNVNLLKKIPKDTFSNLKKNNDISETLEKEGKKEEINKRIESEKKINLGLISSLLLEKEENKTTLKLSLSRKKARLDQFIHAKYLYNCKVQAFFAMASIFTCILEYENTVLTVGDKGKIIHTFHPYSSIVEGYNIDKHYYTKLKIIAIICSYITFIISVFLCISIYYDAICFYSLIDDSHNKKNKFIIIRDWKMIIFFSVKLIFFFICPNPFTFKVAINFYNDFYQMHYEIPLNSILTSICLFFRVWFIFKLYLVLSNSYSQRSFRISKINNIKMTLMFPFKAKMDSSSLTTTFCLFSTVLLVSSYNLRIFERYFDVFNDYNLTNYLNDLWCAFITMTTVGYGDIYPSSFFGRMHSMICCMFGVFLVGLMVVSVTSYLNIDGIDSKIYQILLKSEKMEKRNKSAYKVISQYLKSIKEVNQEKNKVDIDFLIKEILPTQRKIINKYLKLFKIADLDFLKTIPALDEFDNIKQHLRILEENMSQSQEKIIQIVDLIEQLNTCFY